MARRLPQLAARLGWCRGRCLRTGFPRLAGAAVLEGAADAAVVGTQLQPQRPEPHQLAELDLVRERAAPRDKDLGVLRDLRAAPR